MLIVRRSELLSRYNDSLRGGLSGVRIPVGSKFSGPAKNGLGVLSASCTGYQVSFPGVKRPGWGVRFEVKERVEVYLHFPSGLLWTVTGLTVPHFIELV